MVPGKCLKCSFRARINESATHTNNECVCNVRYYWDKGRRMCRPDCTAVPNSLQKASALLMCECNIGHHYDPSNGSCNRLDCSKILGTNGDNRRVAEGVCTCAEASATWNISVGFCQDDCTEIR
jgi:hypothetical protein